ncbi:50S ribosomal protein L6 [bacterium]|nr:50S ribosomal protein L6 [bacterium]
MSRVGKEPIVFDSSVTITLDGSLITVKGPKGQLERQVHPAVGVTIEGNTLTVTRKNEERESRALHGTFRALINNMIIGVSKGFVKVLVVKGTGYKFELKGKKIGFALGFSHPVEMEIPKEISAEVNKTNTELTLTSYDNEELGNFAAVIKRLRPVEPYKGKGISYQGEVIRRKAGKAAGK